LVNSNVFRILDANSNRAREALRVLEEHARLILDDAELTKRTKGLRHDLAAAVGRFGPTQALSARDIQDDVGTQLSTEAERIRASPVEVAIAAAKRASEALRCLEEYGKIVNPDAAAIVEQLRYRLYALEQDILIGGPRRRRLRDARLHVLVTESHCRGPWPDVCEAAIEGGADVIQLREKSLPDGELLQRARRLREMTAARGVLLIINDRTDIARLADADGVHLGFNDLPVAAARKIVGPNRLIGATAHSIDEARAALAAGCDYLAVGPMFSSPTKPEVPVQGPRLFLEVMQEATVPLVAIGGITAENVARLVSQASSLKPEVSSLKPQVAVAVCQYVIAAADAATAARILRAALRD
jgi:thiamine-phosphate pyrophosphorylase